MSAATTCQPLGREVPYVETTSQLRDLGSSHFCKEKGLERVARAQITLEVEDARSKLEGEENVSFWNSDVHFASRTEFFDLISRIDRRRWAVNIDFGEIPTPNRSLLESSMFEINCPPWENPEMGKTSYVRDDSGEVTHQRVTSDDGGSSWLYEHDSGQVFGSGRDRCVEVADHNDDGTTDAYEYEGGFLAELFDGNKGAKK